MERQNRLQFLGEGKEKVEVCDATAVE